MNITARRRPCVRDSTCTRESFGTQSITDQAMCTIADTHCGNQRKEFPCESVNLRLKQYHSLALQTVPVGEREPPGGSVVLFDLTFFGRRPGWRFGTV